MCFINLLTSLTYIGRCERGPDDLPVLHAGLRRSGALDFRSSYVVAPLGVHSAGHATLGPQTDVWCGIKGSVAGASGHRCMCKVHSAGHATLGPQTDVWCGIK